MLELIASIVLFAGVLALILTLICALFTCGSHWSNFCIEWTHYTKNFKHWELISDIMLLAPVLLLGVVFTVTGSIYFLTKGVNDEQTNYQQDRGPAVEACRQPGGAGTHCACACHGDPDAEVRRNP